MLSSRIHIGKIKLLIFKYSKDNLWKLMLRWESEGRKEGRRKVWEGSIKGKEGKKRWEICREKRQYDIKRSNQMFHTIIQIIKSSMGYYCNLCCLK